MSRNGKPLQVGECDCTGCRSACEYKPGWFTPDQIAPLAKALKLSVKQLFKKHLQVDWWVDSPNVFVLSPRLKSEEGGTIFDSDPKGACHWYKDGKCMIHALGKPAECQQLGHGNDGRLINPNHGKTADAWRATKHQKMVRDLYGEEPEASEYDGGFGGLLSSLFR